MLKRVGSKTITIEGQRYRYVISEADARKNSPGVRLALTVQHASKNGSRLRVTGLRAIRVPESESKYYDGRTLAAPILPRHVESLIRSALDAGWQPQVTGNQFVVELGHDAAATIGAGVEKLPLR